MRTTPSATPIGRDTMHGGAGQKGKRQTTLSFGPRGDAAGGKTSDKPPSSKNTNNNNNTEVLQLKMNTSAKKHHVDTYGGSESGVELEDDDRVGDDLESTVLKKKRKSSGSEFKLKFSQKEPTLLVGEFGNVHNFHNAKQIAAFDFDETLVTVKSKGRNIFPKSGDDFRLLFKNVPDRLFDLYYEEKYAIIIMSNQRSIMNNGVFSQAQWNVFTGRVTHLIDAIKEAAARRNLDPPSLVILASLGVDWYRKPCPGMWEYFVTHYVLRAKHGKTSNEHSIDDSKIYTAQNQVDITHSFYVGDAAGRSTRYPRIYTADSGGHNTVDHSDCDYKLALNIGCKFFLPEDIFYLGNSKVNGKNELESPSTAFMKSGLPPIDHVMTKRIPPIKFDSKTYYDSLVNKCGDFCEIPSPVLEKEKKDNLCIIDGIDSRKLILNNIPERAADGSISLIHALTVQSLVVEDKICGIEIDDSIKEDKSFAIKKFPRVIILSGPTGSGKTLLFDSVMSLLGYEHILSQVTENNAALYRGQIVEKICNVFKANPDARGVVIDGQHLTLKTRVKMVEIAKSALEKIGINPSTDTTEKEPFTDIAAIDLYPQEDICIHNAMHLAFRKTDSEAVERDSARRRSAAVIEPSMGTSKQVTPLKPAKFNNKTCYHLAKEYYSFEPWPKPGSKPRDIVLPSRKNGSKGQAKIPTTIPNLKITIETCEIFIPMFDDERWFKHLV